MRSYDFGGKPSRFDATMIKDQSAYSTTSEPSDLSRCSSIWRSTSGRNDTGDTGAQWCCVRARVLRSGTQRFFLGPTAVDFPMIFSGRAQLREWFDENYERFHVDLDIGNDQLGFLFGYRGSFT